MPISLICASHSPLLNRVPIEREVEDQFRASLCRLANHVRSYAPDYVIQFSPDHYQGFFHRLMPSFCVGTAARSAADWDIPPGELDVPSALAHDLVEWLRNEQFDVARSREMVVDHGFLQIWQEMFGSFSLYRIIPIFINCVATPLPSYQRIRLLGEAVGRFAIRSGARVLVVASGGLSHDPPVPNVETAPPEVADRLISGRSRTPEEKRLHEELQARTALEGINGGGGSRPLNPSWDRDFLDLLQTGDLSRFDTFTDVGVAAQAGRGGNEVLTWVAAFAALSIAGAFDVTVEFYHPIPAWIVGAGVVTASPRAQPEPAE